MSVQTKIRMADKLLPYLNPEEIKMAQTYDDATNPANVAVVQLLVEIAILRMKLEHAKAPNEPA
jgi:hypothetical protein